LGAARAFYEAAGLGRHCADASFFSNTSSAMSIWKRIDVHPEFGAACLTENRQKKIG
jgi:hypothetical protein